MFDMDVACRLREYRELPEGAWRVAGKVSLSRPRALIQQWFLNELVESYLFPSEWVGVRIVLAKPTVESAGPLDLCLTTQGGTPFVYISIEPNGLHEAEGRMRRAISQLPDTGFGVACGGTRESTRFFRRRFDDDGYTQVRDMEPYSPSIRAKRKRGSAIEGTRGARHSDLRPLDDRLENVFFEAHSHIRDVDGRHADEALDELTKVLYAKLHNEEMDETQGARSSLKREDYGCGEEFATEIRATYREALNSHSGTTAGSVFAASIRLTNPALIRVVETLQDYDLRSSSLDVKGRAFQKVLTPAIRSGMGQYFTPNPVVRLIVDCMDPRPSELVMDPFCGSAHFLSSTLRHLSESHGVDGPGLAVFASRNLYGIEKSDRMVRIGIADMRLQGDGATHIRYGDALLAFENYPDLSPSAFDVVMTNPPFGSILGKDALGHLGWFELARGRTNLPLEVLGLERCVQLLRPGGRLAIVLPDGLLGNRKVAFVRDWVEQHLKIMALVSLPIETFQPYGAAIKTSVLFARKWRSGETKGRDHNVFLGRIDDVGYDATGRTRASSDIGSMGDQLSEFLSKAS